MALIATFRIFGFGLLMLALGMIAPLLLTLFNNPDQTGRYFLSMVIIAFVGGGLMIISRGHGRGVDLREAMLTVILWWAIAPMFAALPFKLSGESFIDAYFSAVSALTTTGALLSHEAARASEADFLWRAVMQWIGGFASLSIAAVIFIRPMFLGIDTVQPPFARGEKETYSQAMLNAARVFFPIYGFLTLINCFVLLWADLPFYDATILALSIPASGGMSADIDGFRGYGPLIAATSLPFIFLSGVSFVFVSRLVLGRKQRLRDMETGAFAMVVLVFSVALWVLLGANGLERLPAQVFNAASLMSTNGYLMGENPTLPVALVAVVIGGSAVSSAGGLKILRWLVIFRRAREEVRRLIAPNAIHGAAKGKHELGVWMHFIVFTFFLGAMTLAITGGGHDFDLAAAAAVATISNTGPVLSLVEAGQNGYAVFDEAVLRGVLCLGMILGRIEAVTALALLNRAFWRS